MTTINQLREKRFRMKWWGWGVLDRRLTLNDRPGAVEYLKKYFEVQDIKEISFSQYSVAPCRIPSEVIAQLTNTIEMTPHQGHTYPVVCIDDFQRLLHSFGKSYKDLIRVRTCDVINPPDVVFYPRNENQIVQIFQWAEKNSMAIIPFGGGTSVVSGLDILKGDKKFVGVLDLFYFDKEITLDRESLTARVPAHLFGPELEEKLNHLGLTLGHFPQSFEFSTLGGWIAARSSGQNCLGYGGIEKLTQAVRIITPSGVIETINVPRSANGPDIKEMLVGSEGIFGVITEAEIKVAILPQRKLYKMLAFRNFHDAAEVVKKMVQKKMAISMVRVSDEDETEAFMAMGKSLHTSPFEVVGKKVFSLMMRAQTIDPQRFCSVMIGFEGTKDEVEEQEQKVDDFLDNVACVSFGEMAGKKWLKDRFALPYLRDEFMNQGLLVDTLETATTWSNLHSLYHSVKDALIKVANRQNIPIKVYVHISHIYATGASLYFTIIAKQKVPLYDQWMELKEAANKAIFENDGVISHHHGLGFDHKNYAFHNPLEKDVIKSIKEKLDPHSIMNPEKII